MRKEGDGSTYSQTSKTTCCNKSGNFCTMVTGCPDVRDTPYIGAVVLYLVLQRRPGAEQPSAGLEPKPFPLRARKLEKYIHFTFI